MDEQVKLTFEGLVGYSVSEPEEAAHFFEHTLGLQLGAEDGILRFYELAHGMTLAVDTSGGSAGEPPYLLFSAPDVAAAADYFLGRGCQVKELAWAVGAGFIARSPEGHSVAVIDAAALAADGDEGARGAGG